jgi:hypothetical protein
MTTSEPPSLSTTDPKTYPCTQLEATVFGEFSELFPQDIPAILDEGEPNGLSREGSFPQKMQQETSKD